MFCLCRNGTSMISLIIPPKDQISRVSKMLADEFGTASNIKSRVNRLSVLGAITSVQHRLKLYTKGNCPLQFLILNIFSILNMQLLLLSVFSIRGDTKFIYLSVHVLVLS